LETGQTISHYRILSPLGQGGMGVVYVAEDVRLGRRVAIKVLPENLSHDPIAFQRFQREARAAGRLNHPNICTIYEVEEYENQPVIVMELLEGKTLKERLREAPMTFDHVLEIGSQVADALETAHAAGIIHRDIKPANIFLTKRGVVKVLDFGLAKLLPKVGEDAESGTIHESWEESLTAVGVIPGTATYMSPEQVKGDDLDFRTDLFSLGIVLYEMGTGQQPFRKRNAVLTMEAILNLRPKPASSFNPDIPPEFDLILGKLLEKDRTQRYDGTSALQQALAQVHSTVLTERTPSGQKISGLAAGPSGERLEGVDISPKGPAKRDGIALRAVSGAKFHKLWKLFLAASAVFLIVAAGIIFYSHRATALRPADSIVLADFDNKTGDPVFDETLKQALAVDLGQSPFLNIVSDRKVAAALRLMGRTPDQPAVGEVAREVCQRVGGKAMLAGSISALGNDYVIGLNAINCATGDALVKQQVEAAGKEHVLKAVGNAATEMRGKLGESLVSVRKFDTPIEEATTSSLEALKAYSTGRETWREKGDAAATPFYRRAIEIDPNFPLVYAATAVSYDNLGQFNLAIENATRAYQLRERVSEREKYRIEALYYFAVTGELEKSKQVYELWRQSYPRDGVPAGNLGFIFGQLGQWEKALPQQQDAMRLEPSAVGYAALAQNEFALNNFDRGKAWLEKAAANKVDSYLVRVQRYQGAFLSGDQDEMQQQLAWAAGRPGEEDWLLSTQSDTEAYFGHLGKAREFSQRAVISAQRADAKETAASWQANAALREAEFGNAASARQNAMAALALAPGRMVQSLAALALARAGDGARAQKLADSLNQGFPQSTILQGYWLPAIHSATALNEKDPARALQALQTANAYELGQSDPLQFGMLYPIYLRGQAYLLAHNGKAAAAEFQKIIDHRGVVLNFPLGALAHLGLARAYALQGDTAKARAAYKDFLDLWKDADPGIPILQQAKAEYAKLN
jgi:Tfp pilus assembly protein PilF